MLASNLLFSATIISSERYRKLKKYRYALYFLLLILGGVFQAPRTMYRRHPSLLERLDVNMEVFFLVVVITVLVTVIVYFYSKQHEILGNLSVFDKYIQVEREGNILHFPIHEISNLIIERGATYHYEYQKKSYLHKAGNWLKFKHSNQHINIEFLIDSGEQNEKFENMILALKHKRIQFQFLSI